MYGVNSPQPNSPDAAKLVGLLADDARRKVFAALVLGACTADDVAELSGLDIRDVHDALARLVSGGLVVSGADGALVVLSGSFGHAARSAAPVTPTPSNPREKVLATFVADGRLTSMPTARSKRRLVLEEIAQDFEPGLKYSEDEVNAIVGRWHDDYAMVRRYLIDESFLDREAGFYWRSGGSIFDAG